MGQVIPLPVASAAYPVTTAALDTAECLLLVALRWWVAAYRGGADPFPWLYQGLGAAGVRDATFSVDALMAIMARTVRRPIDIRCPRCPVLAMDEQHLLHAASFAQAGESGLAEHALHTTLLSAPGAAFALGPLEGLGKLFAEAGLHFSRRQSPVERPAGIEPMDIGTIPAWTGTVH